MHAQEIGEMPGHEHKEEARGELAPETEATRAHDLAHEQSDIAWTPAEEKKVLLKIDLWILPIVSHSSTLTLIHLSQECRHLSLVCLHTLILELTELPHCSV